MKLSKLNILNIIFLTCLSLIIFYGIIIKTFSWLHYTSFHCDEGFLIHNIINKSYLEMFLSLELSQCCPPLFLILGKFLYSLYGLNETALRFPVYIAQVLSILTFCLITLKVFKNKIAIITANLMFVFAFNITYWAIFFKQYASDILFTNIILLSGIYLRNKELNKKQLFLLSIGAIFCIFASYTAGFIIISLIITKVLNNFLLSKNLKKDFKNSLYFFVPFLLIMSIYFYINCIPTINNEFLQIFWGVNSDIEYFFPQNPTQLKNLLLFLSGNGGTIFPTNFYNYTILIILLIFSIVLLYKTDKYLLALYLLPFLTGYILGIIHAYPFCPNRVSLYLIPIFILLITSSLNINISKNKIKNYIFTLFVFTLFFLMTDFSKVLSNNSYFIKEQELMKWTTTKEFTQILIKSDISPNDYVYGDTASYLMFELYDKEKKINKNNIFFHGRDNNNLNTLSKNNFIYFFIKEEYFNGYEIITDWIKNNCKIIYNAKGYYGDFIKCQKNKSPL